MKNLNKTFKCKCFFFFIYCPHVTDSVSSYLSRAYLWTFFRFTSPPLMKSRKFDWSSGFAAFKSTMALPSFISNPSFLSPSLVNWTKRMVMPYIYFQRSTCWPHHEYGASEGQYLNDKMYVEYAYISLFLFLNKTYSQSKTCTSSLTDQFIQTYGCL